MSPKIYGFNVSVFVTCKELNISFEYVPVKMHEGEHKSAEWIENTHPFGQVPVMIDDDGFKLCESRTIARYLALKYAPESTLVPGTDDLRRYGLFEQAMSVEAFDFNPPIQAILFEKEKVYKQIPSLSLGPPNDEIIANSIAMLEDKLKGYERILSKQKYIAGDEFTFADIAHLMFGSSLGLILHMEILYDETARPNVVRWFKDICSRPSFDEVKKQWFEYMGKPLPQ